MSELLAFWCINIYKVYVAATANTTLFVQVLICTM